MLTLSMPIDLTHSHQWKKLVYLFLFLLFSVFCFFFCFFVGFVLERSLAIQNKTKKIFFFCFFLKIKQKYVVSMTLLTEDKHYIGVYKM